MPISLVTALIDTYNHERYTGQALDSQRVLFRPAGRLCFLPFNGLAQPCQLPASELETQLLQLSMPPARSSLRLQRAREFSQLRDG